MPTYSSMLKVFTYLKLTLPALCACRNTNRWTVGHLLVHQREIVIIVHKYSLHLNPTWTSFWYIPRGVPPGKVKIWFKKDEECVSNRGIHCLLGKWKNLQICCFSDIGRDTRGHQECFCQHDIETLMLEKFFATCGQPKHKVSVRPRVESLETRSFTWWPISMRWQLTLHMLKISVTLMYLMMYFARYVVIMMTKMMMHSR